MQAAGTSTRKALNTGIDALKKPGTVGHRIASAAGTSMLDALRDKRFTGLGGRRGLEAKMNIGQGFLKLVDKLTDNGAKLDPSQPGKYGSQYWGSAFQKFYGMPAGTIRRMNVQKTLDNLSSADIKNLNTLSDRLMGAPAKVGPEIFQQMAAAHAGVTDAGTPEMRELYKSLARGSGAAMSSVRVPTVKHITPELRERVGRAYDTLLYGGTGGPGSQPVNNAGEMVGKGSWQRAEVARKLQDRGRSRMVLFQNTGQPRAAEGSLEYLPVGKAGETLGLPGASPLANDIGFTVFNNAGVLNVMDPVYTFGRNRDSIQLAQWMANTDIPMGTVCEANIADMMVRAANRLPDGKKFHVKYITNGVWYDKNGMQKIMPKALIVNDAAVPYWGEIADAHHFNYKETSGLTSAGMSNSMLEYLRRGTRRYDALKAPMTDETVEAMRNLPDMQIRPKSFAFDQTPGNLLTATHIDSEKALEQMANAPLSDLRTRSEDDLRKLLRDSGKVPETEIDEVVAAIKNPRASRASAVANAQATRELYDEMNSAHRQMQLDARGNQLASARSLVELLQEEAGGADQLTGKSDADIVQMIKDIGMDDQGVDPRDVVNIVRNGAPAVEPLPVDQFAAQLDMPVDYVQAALSGTDPTAGKAARIKNLIRAATAARSVDDIRHMPAAEAEWYLRSRNGATDENVAGALDYLRTGKAAQPRAARFEMLSRHMLPLDLASIHNDTINGLTEAQISDYIATPNARNYLQYEKPAVDIVRELVSGKVKDQGDAYWTKMFNTARSRNPDLRGTQLDAMRNFLLTGKVPEAHTQMQMLTRTLRAMPDEDLKLFGSKLSDYAKQNAAGQLSSAFSHMNLREAGKGADASTRDIYRSMREMLSGQPGLTGADSKALLRFIADGTVQPGYSSDQLEDMLVASKLPGKYRVAYERLLALEAANMGRKFEPSASDVLYKEGSALDTIGDMARQARRSWRHWTAKPYVKPEQLTAVQDLMDNTDRFIPNMARVRMRIGQAAAHPGKAARSVVQAPIHLLRGAVLSGNPSALWSRESFARDLVANASDLTRGEQREAMNLMNRARQIAVAGGAATLASTSGLTAMALSGGSKKHKAQPALRTTTPAQTMEIPAKPVQAPGPMAAPATPAEPVISVASSSSPVVPEPAVQPAEAQQSQPDNRRMTYANTLKNIGAGLTTGTAAWWLLGQNRRLRKQRMLRLLLSAGAGLAASYGASRYNIS